MINANYNPTFIEAIQYSSFILENMEDGLLPQEFWRNVSDFDKGTTLKIKTLGEAQIQELAPDKPFEYTPIQSGEVTLAITDYTGAAWYIDDLMKDDASQLEALAAGQAASATRGLQEDFESKALKILNQAQTNADANAINGQAHRRVGSGSNNTIAPRDFILMKLAFDKAEVPLGGRVAIVDPVCEATLNLGFTGTYSVDKNPQMQSILETGFADEHNFVMNFASWSVITSNRLDKGSFSDGTTTVTDGVANVFMSALSDQHTPLMAAWRRMPSVEQGRDQDLQRDKYTMSCRFGIGAQRTDTLGILITDAALFE